MNDTLNDKWNKDIELIRSEAEKTIPTLKTAIDDYSLLQTKDKKFDEQIKRIEEWYNVLSTIVNADEVTEAMIIRVWELMVSEGYSGRTNTESRRKDR